MENVTPPYLLRVSDKLIEQNYSLKFGHQFY